MLADKEASQRAVCEWRGGKQRCVNGHDGALVNKEGIDGADKESKSDQQGTM